jgi:acetyltransferase-like isoleucine patch superfamily enzyme
MKIMKIWHKMIRKMQHLLVAHNRPVMIAQKRNFQGKKLTNTRISSATFLDHKETLFLSDHVYIGHHNFIEASGNVFIEEGVQITNFVNITTHSSHHSIRLYGKYYAEFADKIGYVKGEIKIGAYTFVGPYSLIMPGATIGKGCMVAAYSLVKGNFPDYSIIAGNPAQVVGNTKDKDKKWIAQYPELQQYYYDNES